MYWCFVLLPAISILGFVSAHDGFRSIYIADSPRYPKELQEKTILINNNIEVSSNKTTSTLSPIIVHGNKFFDSESGEQFFIKGIAYQPSRIAGDVNFVNINGAKFIDPMTEPRICLRDLPYLVQLGVNVVRVYSIDTGRDHDVCFKAFEKAGIYVFADLSEPDISIDRKNPSWDVVIYERYTKVVDVLHKYPNMLGFFAGNEVSNDKTNTDASPFVKSSIRDIKSYIQLNGYRQIPVGYSSNDDAETRNSLADYFACGSDFADFYGINMYEWCGYSTFYSSGYRERTEEFKSYPVPVFFSEFGCNTNRPRPFTEVEALYSRLMTGVWSGGIAYMYFEEPNQYGVVELVNGQIQKLDDFESLQEQFSNVNPQGVTLEEYQSKPTVLKTRSCPVKSKKWEASSVTPQLPDFQKCSCMESTLECQLNTYVKESELKPIFDYACGVVDCESIESDGKSGIYGDFSDCSAKQKASYVINEVFKLQGSQKENCNFKGMATMNPQVNSLQDLSDFFTNSGETCEEVLKEHNLRKEPSSSVKDNQMLTSYNKSSNKEPSKSKYSNKAEQLKFYNNLSQVVGLSAIFLVSIALIF